MSCESCCPAAPTAAGGVLDAQQQYEGSQVSGGGTPRRDTSCRELPKPQSRKGGEEGEPQPSPAGRLIYLRISSSTAVIISSQLDIWARLSFYFWNFWKTLKCLPQRHCVPSSTSPSSPPPGPRTWINVKWKSQTKRPFSNGCGTQSL